MSVNSELQNLLTKMGGTPLESDSNSDLIKKISNAYDGSGGSGSGCKCLVTNSVRFEDPDAGVIGLKLDKTAEEIYDAYAHGIVMVHTTRSNEGIGADFMSGAIENESGYEFYLSTSEDDGFYSASSALDYPVWNDADEPDEPGTSI